MSDKSKWEPKYATEVKYSDFSTDFGTHHMMHFPVNINKETGYGKMFGLGAGKLRAIADNIMAVRAHLEQYPEEGMHEIKVDEHVGKEWKGKKE